MVLAHINLLKRAARSFPTGIKFIIVWQYDLNATGTGVLTTSILFLM
jgi:hypothetical protein